MRQHYTPEASPSRALGVALAAIIGLALTAALVHGLIS